jgi:hypothetical protein
LADRETVSRIAKILARATSDNQNEADASLRSAYARMKRDGVTVRDLLELPTQEIYQDALVRLIDVIVQDQPDLSPSSRRELYARYLQMVVARFSGAGGNAGAREPPRQESPRQEAPREREKEYKQENGNTRKQGNAFAASFRVRTFSFSPAAIFSFLKIMFGRGSFLWHVANYPGMALRLFAASALFGGAAAAVMLFIVGVLHALTNTGPLWDIRLQNAFSFLAAVATIWKSRALYRRGWFS